MLKYSSELKRVSNAPVENFFGYFKNQVLNGERKLKCSRVIRKLRQNVLGVFREMEMGIGKSRLTKKIKRSDPVDNDCEKMSQEMWSRKRKSSTTHFIGRFLKKAKQDELDIKKDHEKIQVQQSNGVGKSHDHLKCNYCGKGSYFDITTDWVQCDKCDEYVHQLCVSNGNLSFSGEFVCKLCEYSKTSELHDNMGSKLGDKCREYLEKLRTVNVAEIERQTRGQHTSMTWHAERKRRLTASNFGRISKCRSYMSKCKLVLDLLDDKIVTTVAMQHGRDNEKRAVREYERIMKTECSIVGLIIHSKLKFLAGSPDRLVNDDGILEVKCPYSKRNVHPDSAALPYLDSCGNLKKNAQLLLPNTRLT